MGFHPISKTRKSERPKGKTPNAASILCSTLDSLALETQAKHFADAAPVRTRSSHPRHSRLRQCSAATGCNTKPAARQPPTATAKPAAPAAKESSSLVPTEASPATAPNSTGGLALPLNFAKHTGDLDDMMKRRTIRALVLINPIGFFYKNGLPKGANYEALEEFEKFVNQKFKTGTLKTKVVFIPMRPDQLEAALNEGIGDIIATAIVITPEREQKALFSSPIMKNVSQVVVTGPALQGVTSFDDLAGKDIFVNPLYISYDNLNKINAERQKAGKQPLNVKAADKNLSDDDLIEMVNAGLIPATITTKTRADLWSQVMPDIKAHPDMVVASEGQLAGSCARTIPS